jgi:AAA domain/Primase C terminal 1 (PriCT-1)
MTIYDLDSYKPADRIRIQIRGALARLFPSGGVVELRAFKGKQVKSGFFDDLDVLAEEAVKLDKREWQLFVTLNEIDEALLLVGVTNQVQTKSETTADQDIIRRRWLLVDLDPVRPSDRPATHKEKIATFERAQEVKDYLKAQGWPVPCIADSGNGWHLLYTLDLPNDEQTKELVKGALDGLASMFDDEKVKIDTAVHNASRITRLYGTMNRKGDEDTVHYPHRRSNMGVWDLHERPIRLEPAPVVTREMLEAVGHVKADGLNGSKTSSGDDAKPTREGAGPVSERIPEGTRNTTLASIAGSMRRRGMAEDEIAAALLKVNERCDPPLEEAEVRTVARSIARYQPRDDALRSGRQLAQGPATGEVGILLSEVQPERVDWLWTGRIPKGKLTVLDGDPGLGKSALTVDLAARVSAGLDLPDDTPCEAAGVVICSAEDGLADTIRPRLDAAGGDPEKVLSLATVTDEEGLERPISIPEDVPIIEEGIRRVEADLVIVDPLMAFFGGGVDTYRDQSVRRALAALASLAERTGAAIVVIRHLTKSGGNDPIRRGGGSIGIIGAARSGMLVAKDLDDEDLRILSMSKST